MKNKISNCEFAFECPLNWEDLEARRDTETRFCQSCGKSVHLAHNEEEFNRFGSEGKCVAIAKPMAEPVDCHVCGIQFDPDCGSPFCKACGAIVNSSKPALDFRQMPMGIPASLPPRKTVWGKIGSIFKKRR